MQHCGVQITELLGFGQLEPSETESSGGSERMVALKYGARFINRCICIQGKRTREQGRKTVHYLYIRTLVTCDMYKQGHVTTNMSKTKYKQVSIAVNSSSALIIVQRNN